MALYAGQSIGRMNVINYGRTYVVAGAHGTDSVCHFYEGIESEKEVAEVEVVFQVDIEFHDHPVVDNGIGRFKVWLDVWTGVRWQQVPNGFATKDLGDGTNGNWFDIIQVKHVMQQAMELYRVRLECRTKKTSWGSSDTAAKTFICAQRLGYIGDFTLDFIPLSIIYCPPGQDMTNSLSHTLDYATITTIGNSDSLQAKSEAHIGAGFKGFLTEGIEKQESQSIGNTAVNGIMIREIRNTVITADNQRAIGRSFWGPLNDLFLIMVNPRFSAIRRADNTIFYEHRDCDQLLIVPAHKLLRPGDDPVVSKIPAEDRRKLLELDPFITNLDRFLSNDNDSGDNLNLAANPYANPNKRNNYRAEAIGLWYLSPGTELNYSIGEDRGLMLKIGKEITYTTKAHASASIGYSGEGGSEVGVGFGGGDDIEVGIQWTNEVTREIKKSASCYLIKNQNDSDHYAIKLFYDRNFGTLMFQKVNTSVPESIPPDVLPFDFEIFVVPDWVLEILKEQMPDIPWPEPLPMKFPDLSLPDFGLTQIFPNLVAEERNELVERLRPLVFPNKSLSGTVSSRDGSPVFHEGIQLLVGEKVIGETVTDGMGRYQFDNLFVGQYNVTVGDISEPVKIGPEHSFGQPQKAILSKVRRIIRIDECPIWKLRDVAGLSSENIDMFRRAIDQFAILDKADLMIAMQKSAEDFNRLEEKVLIELPNTPLSRLLSISEEHKGKLGKARVVSARDLWSEVKTNGRLAEVARESEIDNESIMKWINEIDSKRVSKHAKVFASTASRGPVNRFLRLLRLR